MDIKALSENKSFKVIAVFLMIVIAYSIGTGMRVKQYNKAMGEHRERFMTQLDFPSFTTLDAHYWTRYANELKEGTYKAGEPDTKRLYPTGSKYPERVPLISIMLAKISSISGMSVWNAGIWMQTYFPALAVIPIILLFVRIGLPLIGFAGALVTATSFEYTIRTSFGRVDTDILNLFFPVLVAYILTELVLQRKELIKYLLAIVAGVSMYLYILWYNHPSMQLFFSFSLIAALFVNKSNIRMITVSTVLFLVSSGPHFFLAGITDIMYTLRNFIITSETPSADTARFIFPSSSSTINELKQLDFLKTSRAVFEFASIAIPGFIGTILLFIFERKRTLLMLPILILSLMTFFVGIRFSMYATIFAGSGFAYLFFLAGRWLYNNYHPHELFKHLSTLPALILLVLTPFSSSWTITYNKPALLSEILDTAILTTELNNKPVFSWWGNGYMLQDLQQSKTFIDPGTHSKPVTNLIAKAIMNDNESDALSIFDYVYDNGLKGVYTAHETFNSLESYEDYITSYQSDNSDYYLFLSEDMLHKTPSMKHMANWGQTDSGSPLISHLRCKPTAEDELTCGALKVDMRNGIINGSAKIMSNVFVNSDGVAGRKDFDWDEGYYMVFMLINGEKVYNVMLMHDYVFNSQLIQMYILGNYDKSNFSLVTNGYPYTKVYKRIHH
ncbi:STT3 domain-containing protein [Limisalsivibrio acetivorans]|uniref:STT3 domain-containing protein n=1 Tax=Limisalsivibrio acetivorans TaxID=1304888 RepID=UPI0003B6FBE6|nr:STT3 domain-containing protein [Limisalsivibrio acetivorans]